MRKYSYLASVCRSRIKNNRSTKTVNDAKFLSIGTVYTETLVSLINYHNVSYQSIGYLKAFLKVNMLDIR